MSKPPGSDLSSSVEDASVSPTGDQSDAARPTAPAATTLDVGPDAGLVEYVSAWVRVRSGESGVLPVLGGLIAIVIFFQLKSSVFLSAGNLTNLIQQGAPFVLLSMAEVFVLLLGEIDLSVGYVAGIGAVIMASLAAPPHNQGWLIAIAAGLVPCAAIGVIQGELITRLRLPSFIVTLAGLLGLEGVLIWLIGLQGANNGGTIRISDTVILNLVNGSLSPTAGWVVMAVGVLLFAVFSVLGNRRRRASGLVAPPMVLVGIKIALTAAAGIVVVAVCNTNRGVFVPLRGVPWVVPIVLGFLIAWTFLLNRTRFGRYVYAIGGNAEAARRAGINVRRVRVTAFMLCSLTAGVGGIIYASRLGSISNDVDGGTLVLYAVAGAVIGGTSLFGGRGKMLHALLGGIVIATIYNGMGLIGLEADTQDMVTALVLIAAVAVDAIARQGRTR